MPYTAGSLFSTEFSGQYRTVTVLVDAGTQTGTVQFPGITTIVGANCTLAEAPTAAASLISVVGISGNVVTIREYTPQGTLNTQTAVDFYLTVIGQY